MRPRVRLLRPTRYNCCFSGERGVLSVGEFQRDVRPRPGHPHHGGRLRADACRPLRAVRLLPRLLDGRGCTGMRVSLLTTPLGALFDGRVRSPVVAVLGAASLRRADPRAGAVQGPPVPQGPRRLHGRHLPVRHRSGCPHALHAPLNGLLCSRRSGGGGH